MRRRQHAQNFSKLVNFYCMRLFPRGRNRCNVLRPRGSDRILRLVTRGLIFKNFKVGPYARSSSRELRRLCRYFAVTRYALLQCFGEFQKTRFYYGFRLKKDKKKIEKLHKDLQKESQQRARQAQEDRRLMRRAIQETRVKNREKLGKKNIKKAKS